MPSDPPRALLPRELARLLRLFLLANAIGAGVAVGIWLYAREIDLLTSLRLQLASGLPRALVLPVLGLLGGAAAGGLIAFEPAARGSGIVPVLLWLRGRAVPLGWRVAVVKLLASGLAIGSGIPVGPEGPAIQIGASVARESADALHGGDLPRRRGEHRPRRPEAIEEQAAAPVADAGHTGKADVGEQVVVERGGVGHRGLPEGVNGCTVLHPRARARQSTGEAERPPGLRAKRVSRPRP